MDDEAIAVEAVRRGAQDYLPKNILNGSLIGRAISYAIERKKVEHRLAYLAQHDDLTGLGNRALFRENLEVALARADRSGEMVALLYVDIDGFKTINDTMGHIVGDSVLNETGERLAGSLRKTDSAARLGGDEFAVILENVTSRSDVIMVAQKILRSIGESIVSNGEPLFVCASIGVAVYPQFADDVEALIKCADVAMYRAKQAGGDRFDFYTPMGGNGLFASELPETAIRRALKRGEFCLHYQPKVDVATGHVTSVEALVRWNHPTHGLIMPDDFIPMAEETGLIVPLGEWVLRRACKQLSEWAIDVVPPLRIAINVSASQFRREELPAVVKSAVDEAGVDSSLLEFELTEGMLLESSGVGLDTITRLKSLGCQLSIDDFGTGYSSISYLKSFPLDALKIDRSFVANLVTDRDDAAISEAIIALSHSLRLEVIAEGVEDSDQLGFLRDHGCDTIQGFLVSRPLSADEFPRWLAAESRPLALT